MLGDVDLCALKDGELRALEEKYAAAAGQGTVPVVPAAATEERQSRPSLGRYDILFGFIVRGGCPVSKPVL